MNKVLVELYCAATIKKYDMWFPKSMLIREVKQQVMEEIQVYENNSELFPDESRVMLYLYDRQAVLNVDYTVQQSGIMSGQRIMLV